MGMNLFMNLYHIIWGRYLAPPHNIVVKIWNKKVFSDTFCSIFIDNFIAVHGKKTIAF